MNTTEFDLPFHSVDSRRVTTAWVVLGLVSLILAGVFLLLLVLARTPIVQVWIPFTDFFQVSLVVHVTLSALIWLLSMSAAMWSLCATKEQPALDRLSFALAAFGTLIIVIAPFAGAGNPQMSNYVPVLQHPLFFTGLGLFVFGIAGHALRTLVTWRGIGANLGGSEALQVGIMMSAVVAVIAIFAVLASMLGIPDEIDGQVFFEFLFWGSGHVIQFGYTLLMMISWVLLAHASGCHLELTPRLAIVFQVFLVLPIIVVPFLYLAHDVVSPGHRLAFTELMKYGGLSCLPLGIVVLSSFLNADRLQGEGKYLRSALWSSMLLFGTGGALGFMISGLDIVILAHYQGATVGVTVALMGLTYYLLPRLGFGPLPPRIAFWQPFVYGGGQLMHIAGLAWTGGYGVQRKTAGLAQGMDWLAEIAGIGLTGFGRLLSVIGGLLFLVVAWKSMRTRKSQAASG